MAEEDIILTSGLEGTFQALRNRDPSKVSKRVIEKHPDYPRIPNRNHAPVAAVNTGGWGSGMSRTASTNTGIIYGQPQFFSPVHTPINWQIPSKRLEQYQWARFFYENEPKVAAAIDFYCFDPATNILMSDGKQKRISSIKVGDVIRSHDGSVNEVDKVNVRYTTNEKMLKIKVSGLGGVYRAKTKVTPGHMFLTEKDGEVTFVPVGKLTVGDYLLTPCGYGDKNQNAISDDLSWLIGLYAAEGYAIPYNHISKCGVDRRDHKGVYLTISIEETDLHSLIIEKLKAVYGSPTIQTDYDEEHGRMTIKVYGSHIADDLVGASPGTAQTRGKRLSPWVMKLRPSNLLQVLAGFLSGDGCYNDNNGFQGVSRSKALIEQIANICDMLGIEYSYTTQRDGRDISHNVRISRRSCSKLFGLIHKMVCIKSVNENMMNNGHYFIKGNYIYRKIRSIEEFSYTGNLYDLSVNKEHSYVANRVAVHNSDFPMNDFEHECRNRDVKLHFDKMKDRLELPKWCRLVSHEVHLLGDCFPFVEIDCPNCFGTGKMGDEICEHESGTIRRVVILNPDYVEVHTTSINPDPIIALRPDEELINMVQRKIPGYEKLSPEVIKLISTGQPIRLDNRNVSHLKYGECGYQKFGVGMVRRLFPILSYKTKLMVAQWIVAERLIVPVKIVKVGSDERPAGPADIADVQAQLSQTANDPNLTIVTHHAFDLDFVGAAGRVLTLSNEFEFINQEVLDGMMINNALLNGEGPNFSSAAVGIEAMIQRLETFRSEIARWIEKSLYLPEAKRQGFIDKNPDTGEEEYIVPKIKWGSMHLRDQQQYRTFVIQLYDKGLLSAQTVLEAFDLDPDQEIERKRYDALQFMAIGQGFGQDAAGGAGGGGFGAGGGGSAMPPLGGGGEAGAPPIAPGGEMGGPGTPGGMPSPVGGGVGGPMPKAANITAEIADPNQFGGKVLKKKNRDRIQSEQQKIFKQQETQGVLQQGKGGSGQMRDEKGRIMFTKAERGLIPKLMQAQRDGLIKEAIYPQYRVNAAGQEYSLDFGIPELKIGLEADGEIFHSSREQVDRDTERDMKLQQQGWTILRFTDTEIERQGPQIVRTVLQEIMRKRLWLEKNAQGVKADQAEMQQQKSEVQQAAQ